MSINPGWPAGVDLIELDRTDSTNSEAARRAASLFQPTWIRADQQEQGRGRSGRVWQGATGNLMATLVYRPETTTQNAALRTFVAANALANALGEFVDPVRLSLKWPNDVLLDNGKIAGILLETQSKGHDIDWLAIGFGVNLADCPDAEQDAAFAPVALSPPVDPARFLVRLAYHFDAEERDFAEHGFGPIRQRWLNNAARLGETIKARTVKETTTGIFHTVDDHGCLQLETANGVRSISAADVFF